MGTNLTITLGWNRTNSTITTSRSGPGADDSKDQYADLSDGDALQVTVGSGWPAACGLKRVDFYSTAAAKQASGNSTMYWTLSDGLVGMTGVYTATPTTASANGKTYATAVTLTDVENPGSDDTYWYKVTFDNNQVLDPEVINKSGGGGGRWLNITMHANAAVIETFSTRAKARA